MEPGRKEEILVQVLRSNTCFGFLSVVISQLWFCKRSLFLFVCAVWDGTVGCGLDVRRLDSFMRYSGRNGYIGIFFIAVWN